jgi:sarcosine oxidase/L-pipecolate oxidase
VVLSSLQDSSYANTSYGNDISLGLRLRRLENGDDICSVFPPGVPLGTFVQSTGYLNHEGGWANATQGVSILLSNVTARGGKVFSRKAVNKLLRNQAGKVFGVQCSDGSNFEADVIILATGSWTASSFPDLDLGQKCLATGCAPPIP